MKQSLLALPRAQKRALMILVDLLAVPLCLYVSFSLRYGELISPNTAQWQLLIGASAITVFSLAFFGAYQDVVRHMGSRHELVILKASAISALLLLLIVFWMRYQEFVPRSVPLIFVFVVGVVLTIIRKLAKYYLVGSNLSGETHDKRVVIYGAGNAGLALAAALSRDENHAGGWVIGFIDDDASKHGQYYDDLRVLGGREYIQQLRGRHDDLEILLAIPSVEPEKRREIIQYLEDQRVSLRTLPSLYELASGQATYADFQDVDVNDLLGREAVHPDGQLMSKCITGKVVLVSGAGGSIGSELCRQIIWQKPSKLILLDSSEFNLYSIENELRRHELVQNGTVELLDVLASVQMPVRIERVIKRFAVETIYHAAAYKHVPLVEHNVSEGVRNNVFGTRNMAVLAMECHVPNFVLISTDKAVRPTNTMGATKRMAELVVQALNEKVASSKEYNTRFSMVRFGNVLGSSGSVIPLFKKQIQQGGPVTVTHSDITRYFMTIPEAAQLVIQAGAMGDGGEVYVLDMGEPVKILDLAKRMIRLSGVAVAEHGRPGIDIQLTGLRHGEKLYEELLIGGDVLETDHTKIMKSNERFIPWELLQEELKELQNFTDENDCEGIRAIFLRLVSGYNPQCEVEDILWKSVHEELPNQVHK